MFQYAFGKALSIQYNCDLFFDADFYDSSWNKTDTKCTARSFELPVFKNCLVKLADTVSKKNLIGNKYLNFLRHKIGLSKNTYYIENDFSYNDEVNDLRLPIYLEGYWQSPKYFTNIEKEIRNDFQFNYEHIGTENAQLLSEVNSNNSSVSVHVRRGDYINLSNVSSLEYYHQAISLIKEKHVNPQFFLFSDDPEWVRENLMPIFKNSILVDHNLTGEGWKDMMLMSHCKHHIIANSTFSWWGAWLGSNPNKTVVAPQQWFMNNKMNTKDIFPSNWIQI